MSKTAEAVVLIHGAAGPPGDLEALAALLRSQAQVVSVRLLGHAGRPLPERLAVQALAEDILAQLDAHAITRARLVGYSFGGLLALYLARHWPERVAGVTTIATQFDHSPARVAPLLRLCDPQRARFVPEMAQALARHHAPHDWQALVLALQQLYRDLAQTPALDWGELQTVHQPALVVSGDRDQLVPEEETRRIHAALPNARLLLFPGYAHPFESVPLPVLWPALQDWLAASEAQALSG